MKKTAVGEPIADVVEEAHHFGVVEKSPTRQRNLKQVKTGLISGLNTLGHVCCGETDYPDHSCDRVAARFFAKHSHDPVEASAVDGMTLTCRSENVQIAKTQ